VIANRIIMSLVTGLTKQLDVAWAVGNNQGGRMSAAAIADTTYHVFVIERTDTGVVDVGFDTSATAPTLPANYSKSRRIGSILREAGTIVAFIQDGDFFQRLAAPAVIASGANPGVAAITETLATPLGVNMVARVNATLISNLGGAFLELSDLAVTDAAPSGTISPLSNVAHIGGGTPAGAAQLDVRTNLLAQIRARLAASDGTVSFNISVRGWTDRRGRG